MNDKVIVTIKDADESVFEQTDTPVLHSKNSENNSDNKAVAKKRQKRKTHKKRKINFSALPRFNPKPEKGLTQAQVDKRIEEELTNEIRVKRGKSVLQIFLTNIFTFFNMLYLAIATVLIIYNQWTQVFFLLVAFANTSIAIIQEIRSKKSLDKLKLVNTPKAVVIREGAEKTIEAKDIVLDDIVSFKSGDQICVDSVVAVGGVEVNESMLTGESDSVVKNIGDTLYAGSYIMSGACLSRADKIAEFNYIENLTGKAVRYQKPRSQMLRSLRLILKIVAIVILPLALFLGMTNYNASLVDHTHDYAFIDALTKTAGSIVGMIPAGPFLLTSMTLAVSVIRLSKRKTLVQELYCIEMLARVDVLCLDKTGTITDGTMKVVDCIDFNNAGRFSVKDIMGSINFALKDENMTSVALKKHFGSKSVLKPQQIVPFSSKRKFSAVCFEKEGTFFLGAPDFVLTGKNQRVQKTVEKYAAEGYRVLLLAQSSSMILEQNGKEKLPTVRRPIALIVIEDRIRPDAADTIDWFKQNGVAIKIISGDNPLAVSFIASKVGVINSERYISLEGMTDKDIYRIAPLFTVFGRVSPEQKSVLIKALKANGNTVAMTGDGVNDILAMRESDCAIALAGGSEAARNASHLVLLDNNFSAMPKVVAEGRQVVNNIQAATSMYFMKTIYTVALNFLILLANYAFNVTVMYPFTSANVMLLEVAIVAIPTMVLALQKNTSKIKGRFLPNILKRCLPSSITFLIGTVSLFFVYRSTQASDWLGLTISSSHFSTIAIYTFTFAAFYALYFACRPLNWWRRILLGLSLLLTILGFLIPFVSNIFGYTSLYGQEKLLAIIGILASFPIMLFFNRLFEGKKQWQKRQ